MEMWSRPYEYISLKRDNFAFTVKLGFIRPIIDS